MEAFYIGTRPGIEAPPTTTQGPQKFLPPPGPFSRISISGPGFLSLSVSIVPHISVNGATVAHKFSNKNKITICLKVSGLEINPSFQFRANSVSRCHSISLVVCHPNLAPNPNLPRNEGQYCTQAWGKSREAFIPALMKTYTVKADYFLRVVSQKRKREWPCVTSQGPASRSERTPRNNIPCTDPLTIFAIISDIPPRLYSAGSRQAPG